MTVWVDFVITTMILEMQKFFKEKATNTQELLRQHAQLQGDADKKDEELSQLRMARQGLQSQLEAIQATSEAAASTPLPRYAFLWSPGLLLDAQECHYLPGWQAARAADVVDHISHAMSWLIFLLIRQISIQQSGMCLPCCCAVHL